MIDRTALTVKKPATTIMTTATAKLWGIIVMDAIHPLSATKRRNKCVTSQILYTECVQYTTEFCGIKGRGRLTMKITELKRN